MIFGVLQPWSQQAASANTPPVLGYEFASAATIASAEGEEPTEALALLAEAARDSSTPTATGGAQHVVTDDWFAAFDAGTDQAEIALVPQVTESWLNPDGSRRTVERRGEPLTADGRGIPSDGSWNREPPQSDDTQPPGTIDPDYVSDLPQGADAVREALLDRTDCTDRSRSGTRSLCIYLQIVDLYRNYVIPSQVAADLWEILQDEEGFRSLGEVRDRAGRPGVGISLISDSRPEYRSVLIANPRTGRLLGVEDILIETQAGLDLEAPAIVSFSAFLESEFVDP